MWPKKTAVWNGTLPLSAWPWPPHVAFTVQGCYGKVWLVGCSLSLYLFEGVFRSQATWSKIQDLISDIQDRIIFYPHLRPLVIQQLQTPHYTWHIIMASAITDAKRAWEGTKYFFPFETSQQDCVLSRHECKCHHPFGFSFNSEKMFGDIMCFMCFQRSPDNYLLVALSQPLTGREEESGCFVLLQPSLTSRFFTGPFECRSNKGGSNCLTSNCSVALRPTKFETLFSNQIPSATVCFISALCPQKSWTGPHPLGFWNRAVSTFQFFSFNLFSSFQALLTFPCQQIWLITWLTAG